MAKEYLEKLEALLAPATRKLPPKVKLEVKHFFSGAAAGGCVWFFECNWFQSVPDQEETFRDATGEVCS